MSLPHQILMIAVRVLALVLLYHAASTAAQNAFLDAPQPYWFHAAMGVLALWMWCFPRTLARRLLPENLPADLPNVPLPWLTTGMILLGVWQFLNGISSTVYLLGMMYFPHADVGAENGASWFALVFSWLSPETKALAVLVPFELITGVLLMRYAAAISVRLAKTVR